MLGDMLRVIIVQAFASGGDGVFPDEVAQDHGLIGTETFVDLFVLGGITEW